MPFYYFMRPERKERFETVLARRQKGLTVLLENVEDPHNIAAILRSADSVGVQEVHIINSKGSEIALQGRRAARSADQWLSVYFYDTLAAGLAAVKSEGTQLLATHLGHSAQSLYETDLTRPTVLAFGHEQHGLSDELLQHCDGNLIIPQMGMIQSLNVSVACAVCLYEAFRQRNAAGLYDGRHGLEETQKKALYDRWTERYNASKK